MDEFLADGRFAINPIGIDFDPDDMVARRKAGVSVEDIVRWPDQVTPRTSPPPARRPVTWAGLHATLLEVRTWLWGH